MMTWQGVWERMLRPMESRGRIVEQTLRAGHTQEEHDQDVNFTVYTAVRLYGYGLPRVHVQLL